MKPDETRAESGAEVDAGSDWPPVAGDFVLGSDTSPVAVCTLASRSLLPALAGRAEIAIAGRVYTENVGIEKMLQNLLAEPRLSLLVVCGRESRHRVGQAIISLHRNGVDPATRRIRGATGPEPILPNISLEDVAVFRARFRVVDLINEQDPARILEAAAIGAAAEPPADRASTLAPPELPIVVVAEPDRSTEWTYDPCGFFLIQLDRGRGLLLVEHYDQDRRLRHRLEGGQATALCQTAIRLGLLSLLPHAAYLGRELALAETALRAGLDYQQDSLLRLR